MIKSGVYKRGLVIGAEVLSKTLDWSDRTTAVLFGDGAGGVLLEETEEEHFLGESLNTDGSKGGLESGASAVISPYSDESDQPNPYMQMDGKAIFDFAVKTVSKSIKALVEEKGEPDYFLLHQANIRILDIMAKKIDVSRDKFLANMMSYGNTSAASITPVTVPPVPTPATNRSTCPSVSLQISGPVVWRWIAGLAGF